MLVRGLALVIALGTAFAGCLQEGQPPAAHAPDVSFVKTESDGAIQIASVEHGIDRSEFSLTSSADGVAMRFEGTTQPIDGWTPLPPGQVEAGDVLAFCGMGGDTRDVTLRFLHVPSDSEVGSFTFAGLAAC